MFSFLFYDCTSFLYEFMCIEMCLEIRQVENPVTRMIGARKNLYGGGYQDADMRLVLSFFKSRFFLAHVLLMLSHRPQSEPHHFILWMFLKILYSQKKKYKPKYPM